MMCGPQDGDTPAGQPCHSPSLFIHIYLATTLPPQVRSCLDLSVMWRSHHIEQSECMVCCTWPAVCHSGMPYVLLLLLSI